MKGRRKAARLTVAARLRGRGPLARARVLLCVGAALLASADAYADAAAGQTKAATCAVCHGPMGNSTNPDYPILAGQTARYLYLELRDFKDGRRADPRMTPVAAGLSREDMLDLADYFAAQKPAPVTVKADAAQIEAGQKKAADTLCTMCHLGEFKGQNEIPRVAGQYPQYIVKQLKDFRAHRRTNDAGNMTSVTKGLSDQDIENLAAYIANLQ